MKLIDISIPIRPSLAVWPGDTCFDLQWNSRIANGAAVNLGSVTMSIHTGSHADAPQHYLADGVSIDRCELDPYLGQALVVDLSGARQIKVSDLQGFDLSQTPRVLFKTLGWTDYNRFPDRIPVMERDVPSYLQTCGVVLVGVDVPSVDEIESKDLPNHRQLGAAGISILESLRLNDVAAGVYELIALPLTLVGADGSPVRAVLREA